MLRKRNLNLQSNDSVNGFISKANKISSKSYCIGPRKPAPVCEPLTMEVEEDVAPEYDFDSECLGDQFAFAEYANDIFLYFRYREQFFKVSNYLPHQRFINSDTRAKMVDWLVEIQETFELNHETLYLSVKLLDIFLDEVYDVNLQKLQLVASCALLISSKFDENAIAQPLIDDFCYLSNEYYKRDEIKQAEREILRAVKFDLGAPISYSFLRRYARVTRLDMTTLTLARYYLETSLMFLDFCRVSESLMALACYLVAVRTRKIGDWSNILQKYSGYKQEQVEPLCTAINHMINQVVKIPSKNKAIYNKYSHEVFFQVALIPKLTDQLPAFAPIKPPSFLLK